MTVEFAAYLRTSTEENQSPEDSRRWQLSLAQQLIGPHEGRIVAVYHDIDVSRSLPWSRRPEASRLLADITDPGCGWTNLVIGEPQRAFRGRSSSSCFPCSAITACSCGCPRWVAQSTPTAKPTTL